MKKILLASVIALALFTGCTEEKKSAETKVEAPKTETTKPAETPKTEATTTAPAATNTAPAEDKK